MADLTRFLKVASELEQFTYWRLAAKDPVAAAEYIKPILAAQDLPRRKK